MNKYNTNKEITVVNAAVEDFSNDNSATDSANETIRTASLSDLKTVTEIEARCFPPAEAAGEESMKARLEAYPDHFWILEIDGKATAFVNGMVSDCENLADEMYSDASMHSENGKWQMIFGLDTLPEYRNHGLASKLMQHVISVASAQGRLGLVLTCKDELVDFYAGFGFVNEGFAGSTHGDVVWNQMRLKF